MNDELLPRPVEHVLPWVDDADQTRGWVHPPSGLRFLHGFKDLFVDSAHRYDRAGSNVSVRYAAIPSVLVSVFVFPLPHSQRADIAERHFAESQRDMLSALRQVRDVDVRAIAVALEGAAPVRGFSVRATGANLEVSRFRNELSMASIDVFALAGWGLKLRVSSAVRAWDLAMQFKAHWLAYCGLDRAE